LACLGPPKPVSWLVPANQPGLLKYSLWTSPAAAAAIEFINPIFPFGSKSHKIVRWPGPRGRNPGCESQVESRRGWLRHTPLTAPLPSCLRGGGGISTAGVFVCAVETDPVHWGSAACCVAGGLRWSRTGGSLAPPCRGSSLCGHRRLHPRRCSFISVVIAVNGLHEHLCVPRELCLRPSFASSHQPLPPLISRGPAHNAPPLIAAKLDATNPHTSLCGLPRYLPPSSSLHTQNMMVCPFVGLVLVAACSWCSWCRCS
jgi:hypothetical protein